MHNVVLKLNNIYDKPKKRLLSFRRHGRVFKYSVIISANFITYSYNTRITSSPFQKGNQHDYGRAVMCYWFVIVREHLRVTFSEI